MTYLEEVIGFFLWVGGTYAVGAAVAVYLYFKTGAQPYPMGRVKEWTEHPSAPNIWYMHLRRTSFTPGTVGYAIAWSLGYLCFGYAVWRVYIVAAARESTLGTGVVAVALVHWASLAASAWLTFGTESLVIGAAGQLLNLATSTTVCALVWKLQADGTAALIGAGIAASVYAFLHLIAVVVHISLLVVNHCGKERKRDRI